MSESNLKNSKNWSIFLPIINSTNIYAMNRLSDGLSVHGEVVWTYHQENGRGQRNNKWNDQEGQSVLMSMILQDNLQHWNIFNLNKLVALGVWHVLNEWIDESILKIKWPNDIYIDNKKVCGILIENSFKGSEWLGCVVGIGINVLQESFENDLNKATSLKIATGKSLDIELIISQIRMSIMTLLYQNRNETDLLQDDYNNKLYKKDTLIQFYDNTTQSINMGYVIGVTDDGQLTLSINAHEHRFPFGSIQWIID